MNGGHAVPVGKHKPEGEETRLNLLRREFQADVDRCLDGFPRYARNEVIDALAMLWTARRVAKDSYQRLPAREVEIDTHGLKAEMVV